MQRKSLTDSLRSAVTRKRGELTSSTTLETQGVIADPQHPLRLVTVVDVLLYPLRRISQVCLFGLRRFTSLLIAALHWLRTVTFRTTQRNEAAGVGRGLLGLGGRKWERYEEVFDRLRIVPTGHDSPLRPRHSTVRPANDVAPEIFFYAWRPATRFKKSDPPLPEYRLAVVDARTTSLPSAFAFESLFDGLPVPLTTEDVETMDEEEQREWKRAHEERKRNDESYGRGAVKKLKANKAAADKERRDQLQSEYSLLMRVRTKVLQMVQRLAMLLRLLNHCYTLLPPGCSSSTLPKRFGQASNARPRAVNVFPPLKAGRRNVIVAVNDCGTTSLVRFGEAEFSRWRLAGTGRAN